MTSTAFAVTTELHHANLEKNLAYKVWTAVDGAATDHLSDVGTRSFAPHVRFLGSRATHIRKIPIAKPMKNQTTAPHGSGSPKSGAIVRRITC